jgi:hypothetical protein
MNVYKRYGTALNKARKMGENVPIVRVGRGKNALYIVGGDDMTSIEVIRPAQNGLITGQVIVYHLERLKNANWAGRSDIPRSDQFGGKAVQ